MTTLTPYHNPEPEHGVLGSMLIDPATVIPLINRLLREEDFRFHAEQTVFRAINALWIEQQAVDVILLTDALRVRGKLDAVGGPAFVTHLYTFTPTSANAEYYAEAVHEQSNLYRIWRVCSSLAERTMYRATEGLLPALSADLSALLGDLTANTGHCFPSMQEHVQAALERYEEAASRTGLAANVFPTGIEKLDAELEGGLVLGDYIVLSAVTSGGKSALAGQLAVHAAISRAAQVAIYSYEMTAHQLVDRMIGLRSSIPSTKLRMGKLSEMEFQALTRHVGKLSEAGIHIRDRIDRWTVDDVVNEARAIKAKHGLHLVVVDYLQLVSTRSYGKQREREVAEVSRALIGLAKELNVLVIALSQINDDGMLRESRAIGHDADIVLTIEDAFDPNDRSKDPMPLEDERMIRISKNRNGQRDKAVRVNWFGSLMKFS